MQRREYYLVASTLNPDHVKRTDNGEHATLPSMYSPGPNIAVRRVGPFNSHDPILVATQEFRAYTLPRCLLEITRSLDHEEHTIW